MNITLNVEEAKALLALLDLAVKAGGLQVAQAALPLAVKVQEEMQKQETAK